MKISLIIPHVPHPNLDGLLDACLKPLSGYDELVLVVNSAIGYGKAFNWGMKYARGDYFLCVSNDTVLLEGSLSDMCVPDVVTFTKDQQWGCFFCLPRTVYEKVGGFDERFEGAYWEDADYQRRLKIANIPVQRTNVCVSHKGGSTVRATMNEKDLSQANKERYVEKWGDNLW